jgi:hypothetical protein
MIDVSRNRQEFLQSHLAELASADFEAWARESFEIAIKIVYRIAFYPQSLEAIKLQNILASATGG